MIEKKLGDKKIRVPERIEVNYPYVVLADFEHVFGRFEGIIGDKKVDEFERKVAAVLAEVSPDMTNTVNLKVKNVIDEVERRIEQLRLSGGKVGVIQLDRYIDGDDEDYFRLEVSRGVSGGLVPRPGCDTEVEEQFRNMAEWVLNGEYDQLLVVDDVLAFGDTLVPMLKGFREMIPNTKIKVLVGLAASGGGWQGLERVVEETGVEVDAVIVVKAGEENEWTSGMAMPALRDFTYLGGKISSDEITGKRLNFPYFMPFSVPVISFMPKERRYDAAVAMMDISIEVVEEMNKNMGRDLLMKDLREAGFGFPSIKLDCLQEVKWVPEENDNVWEYLQYCKYLLTEYSEEIKMESLR